MSWKTRWANRSSMTPNFLARHLEENSAGNRAGAVADFLRRASRCPNGDVRRISCADPGSARAARLGGTSRAIADRSARVAAEE
jgi:hypothetical protein